MARGQDTSQFEGMAERAKEAGGQVIESVRQAGSQAVETAKEAGSQALRTADELTRGPMRVGEEVPTRLYVAAVGGSILVSLALYVAGRTHASLFVGLWAPTMLNLALVHKLLQPSQESLTGEDEGAPRKGRSRRKR